MACLRAWRYTEAAFRIMKKKGKVQGDKVEAPIWREAAETAYKMEDWPSVTVISMRGEVHVGHIRVLRASGCPILH